MLIARLRWTFFAHVFAREEHWTVRAPVDAVDRITGTTLKVRTPRHWDLTEGDATILGSDVVAQVVVLGFKDALQLANHVVIRVVAVGVAVLVVGLCHRSLEVGEGRSLTPLLDEVILRDAGVLCAPVLPLGVSGGIDVCSARRESGWVTAVKAAVCVRGGVVRPRDPVRNAVDRQRVGRAIGTTPEACLHEARHVHHCVVAADTHKIDDLCRGTVDRDFATLNCVRSRDVTPRDIGGNHHVRHVDRVGGVEASFLRSTSGANHEVPLDASAAIERHLVLVEELRKSDVLLEGVRKIGPLHFTQVALGRGDEICNVICLENWHDLVLFGLLEVFLSGRIRINSATLEPVCNSLCRAHARVG